MFLGHVSRGLTGVANWQCPDRVSITTGKIMRSWDLVSLVYGTLMDGSSGVNVRSPKCVGKGGKARNVMSMTGNTAHQIPGLGRRLMIGRLCNRPSKPSQRYSHVRVEQCHKVYILRLARVYLGPCRILPGNNQLASLVLLLDLHLIRTSSQYGYHISALNQIQAVLTCQATTPSPSNGLSTCIPMSDATFSLITSMFTVGGFLGSCTASNLMNRRGRKAALQFSGLLVAVGSGLMGMASSTVLLLLGR